jgi:hypothetical protein
MVLRDASSRTSRGSPLGIVFVGALRHRAGGHAVTRYRAPARMASAITCRSSGSAVRSPSVVRADFDSSMPRMLRRTRDVRDELPRAWRSASASM